MAGMRDAMLDIYNNNFGQSFEDIGTSMGIIAQQTKQVGDELANTTKTALAIRDTFGIEVSESIRSVNQLMKNFGLDSESAYNLLAQGAQNGLNANDNLADSINEYSVHFSQIGLGAEEMFNMFANGAASGVFDIDKLGDAIKEFGIRSKDGSKASSEAFVALGLDATKMTSDFATGGEKANTAFETVTQKLMAMKDPVAQNAAGVGLFGTMWEDIGVKGMAALTNTEGGINKNINALGKINEVKYDTFGEAMSGIGRQLQTGLIIPLGEKILPKLQEFTGYINEHMPEIQAVFEAVMNAVGEAINTGVKWVNVIIDWVKKWANENKTEIDAIKILFVDFFQSVANLIQSFIVLATAFWKKYGDDIMAVIKASWDLIFVVIKTALKIINDIINIFTAAFKGDWKGFWDGIGTLLADIWKGFWSIIGKYLELIKSEILLKWELIKGIFTGSVATMYNIGAGLFQSMWDGIKNIWSGIQNWVDDKVSWLKDKLTFWKSSTAKMSSGGSSGGSSTSYPGLAEGGTTLTSGRVLVGEVGPEILDLPRGATVTPLNKAGGGSNVTIQINGANIMDDYGVDRLMDRVMERLALQGVR